MQQLGVLRQTAGRFEFIYEDLGLIVRGPYAEWVLQAAAEIIAETETLRADGKVEELEMLKEFGESSDIELDAAKYERKARFEAVPQCLISMGENDYRWVAAEGRINGTHKAMNRLHDMSLTRNDTFLADEQPQ